MIFKRIARAVMDQNWITLGLEVVVVVIGIYLGLQADDWNEERKNQQQERIYLAKLSDDLDAMRADLLDETDKRTERIERMKSALHALETCDDSAAAQSDIKFAFERYQVSNGIDFLDATYNEMVATGALARIDDQELKQGITYTFSALGRVNTSITGFRVSMPVVDGIVWKHVSYSINERGRLIVAFEVDEICENTELRNAVAEMVDIQSDGRAVTRDVLRSVDDLVGKLASSI